MPEYQTMPTRTTKRTGGNMVPDDPFRVEPEISMDGMAEPAASDGRNPRIPSGKGATGANKMPPSGG